MKQSLRTLALLVPFSVLALPAGAALPIKPGLWETSSRMEAAGGEVSAALSALQQHMATMTPEQRKSLEGMIDKNGGGFTLPEMGKDGAVVTRVCLTPDMIAKSQLPTQPNQHGCTHKNSPVVDGVMTASFNCTNPPAKGQARFVLKNQTSYTMTMNSTATINGKSENMQVSGSGNWIGADCGSVKPAGSR